MKNSRRIATVAVLIASAAAVRVAAEVGGKDYRVDLAGMDRAIRPGDDFYGYTNGGWMRTFEMPADRAVYGSFTVIDEEVDRRTKDLIQGADKAGGPAGSSASLVGAYYAAFMDEAAIEKRGLSPIQSELDAIAGIRDRKALARVLGSGLRADVDALNNTDFYTDRIFGLWVAGDFSEPDRSVGYLLQGGLGMPDRDNYLGTDAKAVELQDKYRAYLAAILKLAKTADADSRASRIYAFEKKIAGVHARRTDSVDVQKANNPWPLPDFATRAPGLDWDAYFEAAGLSKQGKLMVWHPGAATGIAKLAGSEPLETWKDYLTLRALSRAAPLLPKAYADESFRFYGTALSGALKPRDRWKRAVTATSTALGDAVGKLYVEKYFPPEAKTEAQTMVKNIVAAFGHRIDALEWMSPATKEKAKAKLGTLYVGIGYPDVWRDYAGLDVRRDDPLGNSQRSSLFDYRWNLAKLGKPVDKTAWSMTPQTVNAVNLPLQNAMNFPAAILNPPFFDATGDPVKNYGAIGTVIGHEIVHSFDDQGAQFDAAGRLANWWTAEDLKHFQEVGKRLAAQYDAYEPLPGVHVNGQLTLSENIADIAGVSAAFDGYRSAFPKETALVDGFTADQRFFIGFGQIWREKSRPEFMRSQLITDGHAPGEYRADSARNVDPWYGAFDVKPGQKLYLAPEARVRVW